MNRKQFLKAAALKKKTITMDGDELEITELSMAQRSKLMDAVRDESVDVMRKTALIVCMGVSFFDETNPADVDEVAALGEVIMDVSNQILSLSGLGDDSVKEAEKN